MRHALSLALRILLGLLILSGAFGFFGLMVSTRHAPELKAEVYRPMLVRGVRLHPQPVAPQWWGYGTVRPMERADTPAQVSARVQRRPRSTEVGMHVQAGQTLFELDAIDFQLAAASARESIASLEAQLAGLEVEEERLSGQLALAEEETRVSQRDFDRANSAIAEGAGSKAELDQWLAAVRRAERVESGLRQLVDLIPSRRAELRARIEAQRVALRQAEENLRRTVITAPISGVIQSVSLKEGEWAQAGQVVARIVNLERVEVPLRVPVSAGQRLRVGDPVDVRLRQEDRQGWAGEIARIAPEADEQTRSLTVFVEIDQPPDAGRMLRPGQFVAGRVSASTAEPHIVVPRRAIVDDRVYIAAETDNPEAAIWPVARRIAEALSRGAVRSAHPSMSDPKLADALTRSMIESTRLEVGEAAQQLAGAVARPTAAWMGNSGAQTIEDQFVRVLTAHLTPEVATWLMQTRREDLPASLRQEIEQSQRLWAVRAVPVRPLFTLEGEISDIDPDERQWVAVEPLDGSSLNQRILLTSNLDQLIDGALIDLSIGGER
ncbi:MAG: efflux RND transporter periplasmic adaptor subunit [Phycisphaerales bacterium]|nr:efflux RND transporter periplasmic adaptor subunit [Phycisphaerales bacterium]